MARDLVRLITCGSVDDGKSTLIGRLLHDAGAVPDDQLAAVRTPSGEIDVSRLFDGLDAEREQGITIDVAYRHFETAGRRFILADTPGHPQYTRNMVTAASTADVAVVLVERAGVVQQAADERGLAVVDAAGDDEAQQVRLVARGGDGGHARSTPRASSAPSSRRCRSR